MSTPRKKCLKTPKEKLIINLGKVRAPIDTRKTTPNRTENDTQNKHTEFSVYDCLHI